MRNELPFHNHSRDAPSLLHLGEISLALFQPRMHPAAEGGYCELDGFVLQPDSFAISLLMPVFLLHKDHLA